jgi:hypothetical protein
MDAPMQISSPTNFQRVGHISYRAATGVFSGLDEPVNLFFNVPVTSQPRIDVKGYDERIPSILVLLVRELIKRNGLDAEGIFRVPAESTSLERSRSALNGGRGMFALETEEGPHVIASLIKDWFRSLAPEDYLFASLSMDMIHELAREGASSEDVYNKVCETLSEPDRSIFRWIVDLLAVVCLHTEKNLMSPPALATVYSPTLRYTEQTMESFAVMADVSKIIERCIIHALASASLEEKEQSFAN